MHLCRWPMLLKKLYKLKKTFLLESENCQEKVNKLFDTPVQKPAVLVPMVSWDPEYKVRNSISLGSSPTHPAAAPQMLGLPKLSVLGQVRTLWEPAVSRPQEGLTQKSCQDNGFKDSIKTRCWLLLSLPSLVRAFQWLPCRSWSLSCPGAWFPVLTHFLC